MVKFFLYIVIIPIWPAKSYHHWSGPAGFGLKLVESCGGGVNGVVGLS
ncbi:hypothetical protein Hanom_Chr02g00127771 [Helianthus anomalus]